MKSGRCSVFLLQEVFSEESAAQAQAQLGEAMKLLSQGDPQLWQQLQGFTGAAAANLPPPATGGTEEGKREGEGGSVEDTLEDTLRRLRESTQQIEVRLYYEHTCGLKLMSE